MINSNNVDKKEKGLILKASPNKEDEEINDEDVVLLSWKLKKVLY